MCLAYVAKVHKPILRTKVMIGYKVIKDYKHVRETLGLEPNEVQTSDQGAVLKVGVWQQDTNKMRLRFGDIEYMTGYHVFKDSKGAERYKLPTEKVVKVAYMNLTAEGVQNCSYVEDMSVDVARRIKFLEGGVE